MPGASIVINGNTTLSQANAPGAYVNVQQPAPNSVALAAYGLGLLLGSASWGPMNQIVYFSDGPSLFAAFGPQTAGLHNLVTEGQQALSLCKNMGGIRIDDGTAAFAAGTLLDTSSVSGAAVLAYYKGTEGNNISVTLQTGTNSTTGVPTVTAVVARGGVAPQSETFPNIPAPANTNAFWTNFANAINNGLAGVRGPSLLISVPAGFGVSSTHGPVLGTITLSGGTNGESGVTSSMLLGSDGTTGRTGSYCVRGSGATAWGVSGTISNPGYWSTLAALSSSEGILNIDAVANGTQDSSAFLLRQNNNANSDWQKIMNGDSWLTVNDPTLGQIAVSPVGLMVGLRCLLQPSDSTLNKPDTGFGNSPFAQTSGYQKTYSQGQIAAIQNNGLDIISPYLQGYYTVTTGVVTSGKQDQYPVLTAYIARNLGAIALKFIGKRQSSQPNDPTRANAKAAIQHFFSTISDQIDGTPNVVLDSSNNTPTTVGEGFLIGSVTVRYLGIVQQFILNYQGGSTVQIVAQQQF